MGNETDDDDASQPRQTGSRVSFSEGKTKFKQCNFPDRRRLFLCKEQSILLWHSKKFTSYKLLDGLIDDGKYIVFTTCISCIIALNYLHRVAFVFVLK